MTVTEGARSDPATGSDLAERLATTLDGEVRFDDYSRHLFSRDASMYAIEPLGVVFPEHAADVAAVVRIARDAGVTVTPRGAGTSLAGQTTGGGIVVDMSRHMDRIVEIDPQRRVARVEPGVVQDDLNRAAAPYGLMFGPDTSTSNRATIGGMVGNNSAGSGSLRFGMTIDHVRSLDVVLADGTTATLEPVEDAERRRRAEPDTLEAALYRELPEIVSDNADAVTTGYPEFWRRAGGYRLDRLADDAPFDLAKFVVGSEGTLGLVTAAEVDLVPKPRHAVYAVGHFETTQQAIEATTDALSCDPAQVEMMDKTILDLSRDKIEYADLADSLVGDPAALLFVSFTGDDLDALVNKLDELIDLWTRHGHGYHTLRAVTAEQQGALLKVRKASLGLLMAASEGSNRPLAFVEDTAVPPEHLAAYTERFAAILDEHDMSAGFYGHCSVGCLHIRPFVDLSRPDEIARMRAVAEQVKDLAAEYGGVNSSEHGDGLARSEFNRELFGDDLYQAMRRVKHLFDPDATLNPGKIVDAPSMTDNLRDAALPPAPELRTRLQFEVTDGMRGAADRCMNIGVCRKSTTGAMCPSYIATRDEEHTTRGRANALVKALSEPDPKAALGDERLHDILDLCLMCKACKAECPLGVDMAKLKSETLSHYHDEHGVPLRSRIFGRIRLLNRLGSTAAPIANRLGQVRVLRAALERVAGISAQRPLPRYHYRNLIRWFRSGEERASRRMGAGGWASWLSRFDERDRRAWSGEERASSLTAIVGRAISASRFDERDRRAWSASGSATGERGTVNFLADSFTTYSEPHIGRAGIELLRAAGWHVELTNAGCCGRSALSKGLVDDAAASARVMTAHLAQETEPGSPIVGCEPSCLYTLRDEHASMLPGDPNVAAVADRVHQLEELLTEAIDDGRLSLADDSWIAGRRIVFHGHCHQKAEVGTTATTELLRRIPGVDVVELDAGCCGMAGSFGYESEHYELSMTVGRDRLFPAIDGESADSVIAATGTSCREQIFHGTARTAWHPVELLAEAVLHTNPTDHETR